MLGRSLLAPLTLAALVALSGHVQAEPAAREGAKSGSASPEGTPPAAGAQPATDTPRRLPSVEPLRPPPLHAEYAQYGVAINAIANLVAGATCGTGVRPPVSGHDAPCILGSGGGLVVRGGYRSPGPWYFGGAYAFAKMDSSNLYRLGVFQQLWAEMRYLPDTGYRARPYATWGLGGVAYGNEWGIETGGAMLFGGGGVEFEVSRLAVVGLGIVYKPTLIAGWTDTAGIVRPPGVAHFLGLEVQLEVRTELGRR